MVTRRRQSRERILSFLKTGGAHTAQALAARLGITPTGVRQHLKRLREEGLVEYRGERSGIGRPLRRWSLTAQGHERFPDGYGDLASSLLANARRVFGAAGLDKLIDARTRELTGLYREHVVSKPSLAGRVRALAELRDTEGYMAEWSKEADGSYLLIENHCAICSAAQGSPELCRSELELFRNCLGDDVAIERTEHLLDGARRCAWRIASI